MSPLGFEAAATNPCQNRRRGCISGQWAVRLSEYPFQRAAQNPLRGPRTLTPTLGWPLGSGRQRTCLDRILAGQAAEVRTHFSVLRRTHCAAHVR